MDDQDELFHSSAIYIDAKLSVERASNYFSRHKSPIALFVRGRAKLGCALSIGIVKKQN